MNRLGAVQNVNLRSRSAAAFRRGLLPTHVVGGPEYRLCPLPTGGVNYADPRRQT
jgi:hypothetical protein